MNDPKALVGARINAVGYGPGKIEGFRKLWSGGSPHTIMFDDGRRLDLVLSRKKMGAGNGGVEYSLLEGTAKQRWALTGAKGLSAAAAAKNTGGNSSNTGSSTTISTISESKAPGGFAGRSLLAAAQDPSAIAPHLASSPAHANAPQSKASPTGASITSSNEALAPVAPEPSPVSAQGTPDISSEMPTPSPIKPPLKATSTATGAAFVPAEKPESSSSYALEHEPKADVAAISGGKENSAISNALAASERLVAELQATSALRIQQATLLAAENERLRADNEALSQRSQASTSLGQRPEVMRKSAATAASTAPERTSDGVTLRFNLWVTLDGFQGTFEEVMAHEASLLANPSLRKHRAPPIEGSGDLRAYRCADGFVGTYEEVLLHSQEAEFFKMQGKDTSLPGWWVHLDYGASNRRKAATRMSSKNENSLPRWWVHLDHGASNRRKASTRMRSVDEATLPDWWVHLDHGSSNQRKAATRMSAPRHYSESASAAMSASATFERSTTSSATSLLSVQLSASGRGAPKRIAMFTAPDGFCGSLADVVDHARALGLPFGGVEEGSDSGRHDDSSNAKSTQSRLMALEEQVARS